MIDTLENTLLTHELQLGESLNDSVLHDRRADFSLMLAMLVDDVRHHSQFKLPVTEPEKTNVDEDDLRRLFQLPNKEKLALESMEEVDSYSQAELVEQDLVASVRLSNALNPKPLSFRDDKGHINSDVSENTSLHCQKNIEQQLISNKRLSMNANEWLRNVQETIVQSSLITV